VATAANKDVHIIVISIKHSHIHRKVRRIKS